MKMESVAKGMVEVLQEYSTSRMLENYERNKRQRGERRGGEPKGELGGSEGELRALAHPEEDDAQVPPRFCPNVRMRSCFAAWRREKQWEGRGDDERGYVFFL